MTESYLDTVLLINQAALANPKDTARLKLIGKEKFQRYIKDLAHVEMRDTTELSRIAAQLNKQHLRYTDSLLISNDVMQPVSEMEKYFMGRWSFPELLIIV